MVKLSTGDHALHGLCPRVPSQPSRLLSSALSRVTGGRQSRGGRRSTFGGARRFPSLLSTHFVVGKAQESTSYSKYGIEVQLLPRPIRRISTSSPSSSALILHKRLLRSLLSLTSKPIQAPQAQLYHQPSSRSIEEAFKHGFDSRSR